jgi:hypothetical protein
MQFTISTEKSFHGSMPPNVFKAHRGANMKFERLVGKVKTQGELVQLLIGLWGCDPTGFKAFYHLFAAKHQQNIDRNQMEMPSYLFVSADEAKSCDFEADKPIDSTLTCTCYMHDE